MKLFRKFINWLTKSPQVELPNPTELAFELCIDNEYSKGNYVIPINDSHYPWTPNNNKELYDWCIDYDCRFGWDRVLWDKWSHRWTSNGIGGSDYIFIISTNEETATLAKLTWR